MPPDPQPDESLGGLLRQWYPAYFGYFYPRRGQAACPRSPLFPAPAGDYRPEPHG